jgi:hypothetical protein
VSLARIRAVSFRGRWLVFFNRAVRKECIAESAVISVVDEEDVRVELLGEKLLKLRRQICTRDALRLIRVFIRLLIIYHHESVNISDRVE